jgi:hypothetical protein
MYRSLVRVLNRRTESVTGKVGRERTIVRICMVWKHVHATPICCARKARATSSSQVVLAAFPVVGMISGYTAPRRGCCCRCFRSSWWCRHSWQSTAFVAIGANLVGGTISIIIAATLEPRPAGSDGYRCYCHKEERADQQQHRAWWHTAATTKQLVIGAVFGSLPPGQSWMHSLTF